MEFNIEPKASLIKHTCKNGQTGYYPSFTINIDGSEIASRYHLLNLTPEDIDKVIHIAEYEISDAIDKAIANGVSIIYGSNRLGQEGVRAAVSLQRWQNDYAIPSETIHFDCKVALDEMPLFELPANTDSINYDYIGDSIFYEAVHAGIVPEWDGPFDFWFEDDEQYYDYLYERKLLEGEVL